MTAATLEREAVRIRHMTVRAALDRDTDSTGFAIARFTLEAGDVAWNPEDGSRGGKYGIIGPCTITYERRNGRVTARTT